MAKVPDNLRPRHKEKTLSAMKTPRAVKRITFNLSEANPWKTLYPLQRAHCMTSI